MEWLERVDVDCNSIYAVIETKGNTISSIENGYIYLGRVTSEVIHKKISSV